MLVGTVLWYSELKACGFIKPDGQSENIFVHFSALPKTNGRRILNKSDRVTFDVGEFKGKPVAIHVHKIENESTSVSGVENAGK